MEEAGKAHIAGGNVESEPVIRFAVNEGEKPRAVAGCTRHQPNRKKTSILPGGVDIERYLILGAAAPRAFQKIDGTGGKNVRETHDALIER